MSDSDIDQAEFCVTDCTKCSRLVASRTQIVNGSGSPNANLLIVGEAPGQTEDQQGIPFVGQSGSLLEDTLNKYGLNRSDVRITNTVRCRPPDNRDPHKSERDKCKSYLHQEIASVEPSVVLTLGRIPTQTLLDDSSISVTKQVGNLEHISCGDFDTAVLIGIHPAATMYDNSLTNTFENAVRKSIQIATAADN